MVRTERPDAVHKLRVACRACAASPPWSGRCWTVPPRTRSGRAALAGAGALDARDAEVALAHLRDLVAAEPEELVLGPGRGAAASRRTLQRWRGRNGRSRR